MQYITLHHFGPISECERLPLTDFMVLTGPQAQGKSTIAKAIFFFQTIVQDVFAQMTQKLSDDDVVAPLEQGVQKRLQSKFLRTFGSDRGMPLDMKMMYHYTEHVSIEMVKRTEALSGEGFISIFPRHCLLFFLRTKMIWRALGTPNIYRSCAMNWPICLTSWRNPCMCRLGAVC